MHMRSNEKNVCMYMLSNQKKIFPSKRTAQKRYVEIFRQWIASLHCGRYMASTLSQEGPRRASGATAQTSSRKAAGRRLEPDDDSRNSPPSPGSCIGGTRRGRQGVCVRPSSETRASGSPPAGDCFLGFESWPLPNHTDLGYGGRCTTPG